MVDASLGGKTGVDLPQGKNLVGAFCPPKLILTDPLCLQSLPREELRNGMAEVLKHGVISSVEIFNICLQENWEQELSSLLPKAMAAKIQFLSVDPYEKGIRAVLNFGHTIGHALELVSGYQLRHGEAVGLGMLWEAKIALELGLCKADLPEAIQRALQNLGLPVVLSEPYPLEAVLAAMQTDKKRADGKVKFVLPHQIGQVSHGHEVGVDLLRRVLRDEMA
jgi:3-dehydroquinate synthetase